MSPPATFPLNISLPVALVAILISAFVCRYAWREASRKVGNRQVSVIGISFLLVLILQSVRFSTSAGIYSHFSGAVLVAAVLGPVFSCLILAAALTVRALLFADYPLINLGIVILNVGVLGGLVAGRYILNYAKGLFPHTHEGFIKAVSFTAWCSLILSSLAYVLELIVSGNPLYTELIGAHFLVGVGEALFTGIIITSVLKRRPDLVVTYCCGDDKDDCIHNHHDHHHDDIYSHN
ncbi:MAG: energy-coupling factor ABC transporter permease [bacterium]